MEQVFVERIEDCFVSQSCKKMYGDGIREGKS